MSEYTKSLEFLYVEFLDQLNQMRGMDFDLASMEKLCTQLGNPELRYPVVHVLGTNGKGSVVHKSAKALSLAGYRVGTFTSPHIATFRERIQIDGKMISEERLVDALRQISKAADVCQLEPSFFAYCTLMALIYFAEEEVDIAFIEAGVGGRLDLSSVTRPDVAVLTSVGWDHQAYLGNTLDAIAMEKVAAIKPYSDVVLGCSSARDVVLDYLKQQERPPIICPDDGGDSELGNQRIARNVLAFLQKRFPVSEQWINEGVLSRPTCRFEIYPPGDLLPGTVIFDVAHNLDSMKALRARLDKELGKHFRVVLGMSASKDANASLEHLPKESALYFPVLNDPHRQLPVGELAAVLEKQGKAIGTYTDCLEDTLAYACQDMAEDEVLLVTGSFFHLARVRAYLGIQDEADAIHLCDSPVVRK